MVWNLYSTGSAGFDSSPDCLIKILSSFIAEKRHEVPRIPEFNMRLLVTMYYKIKLFFDLTDSLFIHYLTSVTFAVSTSSSKSLTFTETDTLFPAFDSEKFPCVEWQLSFSDRNRRVRSFSRSGDMVLIPRFGFLFHCIAENEFRQGITKNQFYKYYNRINSHKKPFALLLTQTMKRDMWYSTPKFAGTEVGYMKEKTLSMQKLSSQLSTEGDILLSPRCHHP